MLTREAKGHLPATPILKDKIVRNPAKKWKLMENRVSASELPSYFPQVVDRQVRNGRAPVEICALQSCHHPLGILPWQEAANQTGTMQSSVPLLRGCQELSLTSCHFSQGEPLSSLHSKPQTCDYHTSGGEGGRGGKRIQKLWSKLMDWKLITKKGNIEVLLPLNPLTLISFWAWKEDSSWMWVFRVPWR